MTQLQKKYSESICDLMLTIIWAQWNRMGLNGTGGINRYSVDIESALIAAGYGSRLDGRLYEGMWTWLERYESIVNAERLATLIGEQNDEWIARFLGSMFEKINPSPWKGVLKKCEQLCSTSWKATPLLLHAVHKRWREEDPVMSKWGILYDRVTPQQKMKTHNVIIYTNALMRYRYVYGTVIRADVLYMLSLSPGSYLNRKVDFLTSVCLADRLRCHLSTIHRIQKDFEEACFIEPLGEVKKNRALRTTWLMKEIPFLSRVEGYDLGMIDWVKINNLFGALLSMIVELGALQNETIAKARLQDFQSHYFGVLKDHGIPVPTPYGTALGPLAEYSIEKLMDMIHESLLGFYRILCCVLLLRCRKCCHVFDAPFQGNMSSMKESSLVNNRMTCPHCEFQFLTSKPDFFYYDGLGREQAIFFNPDRAQSGVLKGFPPHSLICS